MFFFSILFLNCLTCNLKAQVIITFIIITMNQEFLMIVVFYMWSLMSSQYLTQHQGTHEKEKYQNKKGFNDTYFKNNQMACVCVYRNDFYLELWPLKYFSFFIYVEIWLNIDVEVLRKIVARWFRIVTQFVLRSLEWATGNTATQREGIVTRLLDNY